MPLLVRCKDLEPGMRLAESLVWRGLVMLTEGTVLTATDVQSLRDRFPDRSLRIGDNDLDSAVEFEDDSHEREVARKARRMIADCLARFGKKLDTPRLERLVGAPAAANPLYLKILPQPQSGFFAAAQVVILFRIFLFASL